MKTYQVTWTDRKGAGCMRQFLKEAELNAFVSHLRCEGTIYFDGRKIGEIIRTDAADDRRIKWLWAYESQP